MRHRRQGPAPLLLHPTPLAWILLWTWSSNLIALLYTWTLPASLSLSVPNSSPPCGASTSLSASTCGLGVGVSAGPTSRPGASVGSLLGVPGATSSQVIKISWHKSLNYFSVIPPGISPDSWGFICLFVCLLLHQGWPMYLHIFIPNSPQSFLNMEVGIL